MKKTKSITTFDVVLVAFPFSDLSRRKQRPCLVLSVVHPKGVPPHVLVAMMTSQLEGVGFPHDLQVNDWKAAGLPKPTLVRISKVVTLEEGLIHKKIGRLSAPDCRKVRESLRQFLDSALA